MEIPIITQSPFPGAGNLKDKQSISDQSVAGPRAFSFIKKYISPAGTIRECVPNLELTHAEMTVHKRRRRLSRIQPGVRLHHQ
jgi:hypothetical protein